MQEKVGKLRNGEAVYHSLKEGFSIEKDYRHLAKPTKEEMQEINSLLGKWGVIILKGIEEGTKQISIEELPTGSVYFREPNTVGSWVYVSGYIEDKNGRVDVYEKDGFVNRLYAANIIRIRFDKKWKETSDG